MPWDHCGQQLNDDVRCPVCGASKRAWTFRLGRTRLLRLGTERDTAAQVQALRGASLLGTPFCEECRRAAEQERVSGEEAPA